MDADRNRKRLTARLGSLYWLLGCGLIAACGERLPDEPLALLPAGFDDLPGWQDDALEGAMASFRRSCASLAGRDPETPLIPADFTLTVGDLAPACQAAQAVAASEDARRNFFEAQFSVWRVIADGADEGLFTGYYVPRLAGSRRRYGPYQVPLYRRPPELVLVNLGDFRADLKGRRIAGAIEDGRLKPYPDRAAIEAGALADRALELVWVTSAVDAFFLHIQGSGQVALDSGETIRVGYDGANGQPYVAIGRRLIEMGALEREAVSLQSIKAWMTANPGAANTLMRENPSYVFFRELEGAGVLGADATPLTGERSIAVDRRYIPLGLPYWLVTRLPDADKSAYHRLLIAQDTGGAIRGGLRGDVFFGSGARAEQLAGMMKQQGRAWLLLPKGFVPTHARPIG